MARKKTHEQFLAELFTVNSKIEVLEEYKGTNVKLLLRCGVCGNKWKSTPHDLLSGHGCPVCGYEKQKKAQRCSNEEFLLKLEAVNPDICAIDKYVNNHTKIRFKCKTCGRIWKTVPNSVLLGHGCPNCARSSTSFLEQVILQAFRTVLGENSVLSRDRKLIGMELDIVIPALKIAYEPGSWAWHYNKKQRDIQKRNKCREKGYRLITIFTDYKANTIPFDNDCYILPYSLGNSNWDETKEFVKGLLCEQNLLLEDDQWNRIKLLAIENSRKRTDEEFVAALHIVNPNIKVIGRYIDNSTKVKYMCLLCKKTWEATPGSVLSGHGCPACGQRRTADSKRKTHEQFLSEMATINSKVKVLGKYTNTKTKILCECYECGNRWEARPQNLLKGQGCPKCGAKRAANKNRKTYVQFINVLKLKNPSISVRGKYVNSSTKVEVECNKCGYIWLANPTDIMSGHGCPKCAGSLKKTNSQFISDLKRIFPNVIPLEEYRSANEKIQVKCAICDYTWSVRPHDLLRSRGCPNCRKNGT